MPKDKMNDDLDKNMGKSGNKSGQQTPGRNPQDDMSTGRQRDFDDEGKGRSKDDFGNASHGDSGDIKSDERR